LKRVFLDADVLFDTEQRGMRVLTPAMAIRELL
jgi:hypothetical protein